MLRRIEDGLSELARAPVSPPESARQRTLDAMARAAAVPRAMGMGRAAAWIAVAGIGAALGLLALQPETSEGPRQASGEPQPLQVSAPDAAYLALAETSSRLERILAEAPPPRQVMRVSTAGTIVGLEDQIALIDAALARAPAPGGELPGEYRTLLMRDRVAVMNALVHVRYAQSYAFSH